MIGLPFAGLVWLLFDGVPSNGFLVILGMVYYGIGANLCYCLGAPAELVAKACWKENTQPYGPVLLTLGLIFSVLLTIGLGALSLLYAGWMGFHLLPLQQ
jgi:hypothetical protein